MFPSSRSYLPPHILILLIGLGQVIGCTEQAHTDSPAQVVILAAASTKDALQEMANAAVAASDVPLTIEISTGPSHALAQQILSGAPADIYVSANRRWAEQIADAGLSAKSIEWLGNALVLVVPEESQLRIERLDDLNLPAVQRIGIAGANVPAGIYAEEALKYHHLWENLTGSDKLIRGHDVRSTLAYVQRGEVDAAIVYSTDAMLTDEVRVIERFDPASHEAIVYPLVRIRSRNTNPAADHLFEFLQSDEARKIAENYGFVSLSNIDGVSK